MKTPSDVIREIRQYAKRHSLPYDRWADALEQAMREPVAEIEPIDRLDGSVVTYCRYDHDKLPPGTKLFAFPPDAEEEIERLTELLRGLIDAEDAIVNYRVKYIGPYPNVPIPEDVRAEWNRQLDALAAAKLRAEKAARAALAKEEDK
jgi:hypothetical protein